MVSETVLQDNAIVIVGLGPGGSGHVTREAWDLLSSTREVFVRTRRHPTIESLPAQLAVHSFDHLYEDADGLSSVYSRIAQEVLALARRPEGVVYAVPGHPLVGETSVQIILALGRREGIPVRVVDGLSFIEPVLVALGRDGLEGLQLADATDLALAPHPLLDPDRPALVGQLYSQELASDLKLTLMNAYPDDHRVKVVRSAGLPGAAVEDKPLHELDRGAFDHLSCLFIPPLARASGMPALQQTVAHLRAPGGCPWDQEQTHRSLRPHLLEESYEVLAALDEGSAEKLSEELGDLLMQVVMHAQIAAEAGEFHLADVIRQIDAKLRRRHPHVFGDVHVRDAADVLRNWEAIKREEGRSRVHEESEEGSLLSGIPATLPALARAQSISERVARAGFEWPDLASVLEKLAEEVGEIAAARERDALEAEFGDVLFTLVNVARWLNLDAESALRATCDRFSARYSEMERQARALGTDLADLPMPEQEALWQRAKNGS